MSDQKIDVAYIAKLARIELSDEETARFTQDLDKILDYVTTLKSYDVTGIEPMNHPLPTMDVLRKDEPLPGLSQEEALSNAPQEGQGQFRTPKVVESA
ncbi:MAG: Asp-tRNA(Asn)/Glu-tRNA(Gln) amidotransferase subunit GatC [Akkermansia sp.]|nr:Asp-tRNA(Asn)/Glu-tRNA(Gln) amidotransferase subunit GatC [Akkermansia sp.]